MIGGLSSVVAAARSAAAVSWGDVPTWLQAAFTFLLLVAAVVAGVYTSRIYKIESGRDKQSEEDRRKEQAAHVAAWIEWREAGQQGGVWATPPGYYCILLNTSPSPVYNVLLQYVRIPPGLPLTDATTVGDPVDMMILPPGERVEQIPGELLKTLPKQPENNIDLHVDVTFVDGRNRRWRRGFNGELLDSGLVRGDQSPAAQSKLISSRLRKSQRDKG